MKRFFFILRLLTKVHFIFKNPEKSKIILFDDQTHGVMKNVLDDYKYFLLKSRVENITEIYLTKKILNFLSKILMEIL